MEGKMPKVWCLRALGNECLTKKAGTEDHVDAAHHVLADTEMKPALLVA